MFDVNIHLIHGFSDAPIPRSDMIGEDILLEYYMEDGALLCMSKNTGSRHLSACRASAQLREMTCWLNFTPETDVNTLGNILRMIPLRRILLHHGVLFLHASQISLADTGILFAAPSRTGKTTQAKLWRAHRGAQILCNDRTLTDCALTYGFPMDGSEPVISGERRRLGAVVILRQAPENTIARLSPREGLPLLMPQVVLDVWDPVSRAAAADRMLDLLCKTPVYLLSCTPDERAVQCLERQLLKDGVIPHAYNSGSYT